MTPLSIPKIMAQLPIQIANASSANVSFIVFIVYIVFSFYVATNISGEKHIILSFSLLFREISLLCQYFLFVSREIRE